ncbi:hypothetical protein N7462_006714 [Penicillium macrosclerotiorum]|uniref:uncharacterized protein n=1 Tax=Penicillium macrosclerotiorum TaxID=303699 RepID=UPI002548F4BB|nr:uncharacterized protein N7462_006714 [Penicillium macrosclerotiorum]KAJ5683549.1 hypothetical protein N7462_006714 [Penicillium macrosclerotiorum]
MLSILPTFLTLGATLLLASANSLPNIIYRDVAIIGGGASGAYAAVRLRDDFDKSIALIEKQSILGGMVDTYVDENTGATFDYGVQSFLNVSGSTEFFARFNIPISTNSSSVSSTTKYIDFNTGEAVDFTAPAFTKQFAAIAKFFEVIKPWESMLSPGYWNFPEPKDIPEDLLIPFGQFLTKHGLEDSTPLIYASTGLGVGNISEVTTMFVLQSFGWDMSRAMLGEMGLFTPASGGNQVLYDAIANDLGDDVLYSSTVIDSRRTEFGVFLTVRNHKTQKVTLIVARRLLVAIEPTQANMKPLDLSSSEWDTLSKFTYSNEFTGLVNNAVFNTSYYYYNLPSAAAPDNLLVFQDEPMVASFQYTGLDHLFRVMIIGNKTTNAVESKVLAQESFSKLLEAGLLSGSTQDQKLSWAAFSTHGPMHARVSVEDIKSGFFQDLYKLQGARSTWFTGGAFSANFQTQLWKFDEGLIPKILEGL